MAKFFNKLLIIIIGMGTGIFAAGAQAKNSHNYKDAFVVAEENSTNVVLMCQNTHAVVAGYRALVNKKNPPKALCMRIPDR